MSALVLVLCSACPLWGQEQSRKYESNIYVPYEDMAQLIEPVDKAVLMDRAEFERLLAAAQADGEAAATRQLGQVVDAQYSGTVSQDELTLTGELQVVSLGRRPVAVALGLGQIGLSRVLLDGEPAPLGYDKHGRLTLIVTDRGKHRLEIAGTTRLKELPSGGMQFSVSVPAAVGAKMKLTAPGDLEMHATAPASKPVYDKQADRTTVELTLGGKDRVTAVLLGNGRQEDEQPIVLGESAATVSLTRSHQVLSCLYTVQVLRRGVRELQFQLPEQWTVTDVTCPSLVRWSIEQAQQPQGPKTLSVRLRSAKVGTTALHIQATAQRTGRLWQGPRLNLIGAALQRGYLIVDVDEGLRLRAESLSNARREDPATTAVPGMVVGGTGQLYFHWGENWLIELEVAPASLRRSIKEQQSVVVSPEQVILTGEFEVTAIDRELFDVSFTLAPQTRQWYVQIVQVDGRQSGFEYRIEDQAGGRVLRIELARPVPPEKVANVRIVLQHVPPNWHWPSDAAPRRVTVPLIESQAETVNGHLSVWAAGDLDAVPVGTPTDVAEAPVGRIATLQLPPETQHAFSYKAAVKGQVELEVLRRRPRMAAQAVGLITVRPQGLTGQWRVTYDISRASAKRVYLLADKFLAEKLQISSTPVRISSKSVVSPDEQTLSLPPELIQRYDVWLLNLDRARLGNMTIDVSYELPLAEQQYVVPLVRPICPVRRQDTTDTGLAARGRISELLAVQASEELALTVASSGAKKVDAIDLPPLPAAASRILEAFRLQGPTTPTGAGAAIILQSAVHENYGVPSALAVSADLTTYIDVQGWQRTEATLNIANAGLQFLTFRLPGEAQLWSARVGGAQAKPQRNAEGDYQLALGRSREPVAVGIVYGYRPAAADLENLELGGVEIPGVEINKMRWRLVPPPGFQITTQQTKMQTVGMVKPRLACAQLYRLLAEYLFKGSFFTMTMKAGRHPLERAAVSDKGFTAGYTLSEADDGGSPSLAKPVAEGEEKYDDAFDEEAREQRKVWTLGREFVTRGATYVPVAEGRYTLPVELVATAGGGRRVNFEGLGAGKLIVGLTAKSGQDGWWIIGSLLILAAGVVSTLQRARFKATLVIVVLAVSSLMAIWRPGAIHFANGAFVAGLCLLPLYALVAFIRWLWPKLRLGLPGGTGVATTAALLVFMLVLSGSAQASPDQCLPQLVIPYEGDPTLAHQSQKVLIPYSRFVELWNQAHPEDPIDGLEPGADISLADVQYKVTVTDEQLELLLTADVRTYGSDWVTLALPVEGLAVTQVTLDGAPAAWQGVAGSGDSQSKVRDARTGTVLMLPGETTGRLRLTAVAKPEVFGRRGSVSVALPPLPAAVMKVVLPAEDLELEVDEIEGALSSRKVNGKIEWTAPLGMTRKLTLRWLPKAGAGAEDRTLSAEARHDVYVFGWAIVAATEVQYAFSAGEHDRFVLHVPAAVTLTELRGANLRDYRQLGDKTIDGELFRTVEVRLHRPAKKQYTLTARWLADLPMLDEPTRLLLLRAGDVARESGTATLHAAGGMIVKVAEVSGGRRVGVNSHNERSATARTQPVAKYYWPYRPFSLSLRLSRLEVSAKAGLDQLVRLSADQVELLVEATVQTDRGRLFGADFVLPDGYELLNVAGPVVDSFYERTVASRRLLNVKFNMATQKTTMALVLVRSDLGSPNELADFQVPTVVAVDAQGQPLSDQRGRIAVQLTPSLDAQTISSENVKSIVPRALQGWLDDNQISSVQFACSYEVPRPVLRLKVTPQTTEIRAETFVALVVRTASAAYTYRIRYNITGSPIDRLQLRMPSEYAPLVAVQSPAMRSMTQSETEDGQTIWNLALTNEVTGIVDVTANFSLPIDESTDSLVIPRLETDTSDGGRAIVAVQNISRHEVTVSDAENLEELSASEQRRLIPQPISQSLQYVYQSFEGDWSLSLNLTAAEPASRIQAVVDLLALTTVIDRNGRCRYEAKIALQNRSEQFLRVRIPEGLRLWSANVADQPVKPVISSGSPPDEVLIPLVKTSPGGLPYEVYLYLADEGQTPLLNPMNGMTRLKPPAISIVAVPVMQTVWSLRLPDGYRYFRPAGNMSPVAGTAEMLSLNIEAKLQQLGRLDKAYREVAGTATQKEQVAAGNWDVFNKKLTAEIELAQRYLESNRYEVAQDDYERLRSRLNKQGGSQRRILGGNTAYVDEQVEFISNNLNDFINNDATNAGAAYGGGIYFEKPEFVEDNEARQLENLRQQLDDSQKQQAAVWSGEGFYVVNGDVAGGTITVTHSDIKEAGVPIQSKIPILGDVPLVGGAFRAEEMGGVLDQLSEQNAAQMAKKEAQIRIQMSNVYDNRAGRYFQRQADKTASLNGRADGSSVDAPAGTGTVQGIYNGDIDVSGPGPTIINALVTDRTISAPEQAESVRAFGLDVVVVKDVVPEPATPAIAPYVAGATYSLPVTLPQGGIRLHFARPLGDPELSIWAVPINTMRKLYASVAVIVVLILLLAAVKFWPSPTEKKPISRKRIMLYVALLVGSVLLLGLLGLIISAVVLLLLEARRGIFAAPSQD
jgi:hypothetical protein